ncbi:MAG: questin oxidase family protein [Acidimicrobiales bacterium]
MPSASSAAVLSDLLEQDLDFDATTRDGLTNHLPMALVAKAGLGAGAHELTRFAQRYQRRLRDLEAPRVALTSTSWRTAIGHHGAYSDLVDYFWREVQDNGSEVTLRSHLGYMSDGISGAAFHGVIRLAYALEVNEPRLVSTGLAYLAASALTLGPLESGASRTDDPAELLASFVDAGDVVAPERGLTIGEEMSHVASSHAFGSLASALAVDDTTPSRLAALALRVYASTNDFTALHGVTGLEAIERLRPYVEDTERFDRAAFQALSAAYLSIGAPTVWSEDRLGEMASSTKLTHDEITTAASRSNDEHVAKVVYSSTRRGALVDGDLYRAVSERAVLNDHTTTTPGRGQATC